MKAYKGFKVDDDGGIYCQPNEISNKFYYEEGKTYECDKAKLCNYGFHACTLPMDVFCYYNSKYCSVDTEYHEVELEGVTDERRNDSKVVGTKITIGRKVTIDEILDISIKMMIDNKEKYFPDNKPYKIRKDTKWNYLKPDGTYLTEQWFDDVYSFENGFAIVKLNSKYNIIKPDGTYLTEQWFETIGFWFNGLIRVKLNNKWNYLNLDGTLLSDQWFDWADDFLDGFAIIRINDEYNWITEDGTYLTEQWYDWVCDFENGFARVYSNDKYNWLKEDGTYLTEQWFDNACSFNNGLAIVYFIDKGYNFIREDGTLLSEQWFECVWNFNNGFALVKLNDNFFKLNTKGELTDESI